MIYIDMDGYWGDKANLVFVDDSNWSEDDEELFVQASNDGANQTQLVNLAMAINEKNGNDNG